MMVFDTYFRGFDYNIRIINSNTGDSLSNIGYKNSQTLLDGICSGAITPGKPKFTREPKFDLDLSSEKLNVGPT